MESLIWLRARTLAGQAAAAVIAAIAAGTPARYSRS